MLVVDKKHGTFRKFGKCGPNVRFFVREEAQPYRVYIPYTTSSSACHQFRTIATRS